MAPEKRLNVNPDDPSYLIVLGNGSPSAFPIERGESVFVGSGSNCRVVLKGQGIAAIHCMIWLDDEKHLQVRDWNTQHLFLNGRPVQTDMPFSTGDQLLVGDYQLIPVLCPDYHRSTAAAILEGAVKLEAPPTTVSNLDPDEPQSETNSAIDMTQQAQQADDAVAHWQAELESELHETDQDKVEPNVDANHDPQQTDGNAESEASVPESFSGPELSPDALDAFAEPSLKKKTTDDGGFEYDIDADLKDDFDEDFDQADDPFSGWGDPLSTSDNEPEGSSEDAELLRMEVEQLRFELADRDRVIAELKSQRDADSSGSPIDHEETLKLVNRLEELLDELKASDQRVHSLEELLRLSDQATQAEQEERRQLENWVGEIEVRVEQHDAEKQAEIERLNSMLDESKSRLRQAHGQLKQMLAAQESESGAGVSDEARQLIQQCRGQIEQLQDQLAAAQAENEELKARPAASPEDTQAREQLSELQQQLAELQVSSSRERAEMARKHAELERMRDELQEKLSSAREIGQGDSRIKAMREHLREIHEQEKQQREEDRQSSLGGRIARLLSRTK